MADSPRNRVFNKSRVANVMSAVMILVALAFIGWIIHESIVNGGIPDHSKDMVLALVGTTSMIAGFALRFLFEEPCPHCSRDDT